MEAPPSGLHTKIKHKIISYHFSTTWKNIFKGNRKIYNLWYVDLFCGPGFCRNEKISEELLEELPDDWGRRTWEPPFFVLMKYADESNFNLKCFFNDSDEEKIDSLQRKIEKKGYNNFVRKYESEDANSIYKKALDMIGNPKIPSVFFLDPSKHNQLNFGTVKSIAEFKSDSGRRPELIVNLMMHSIFMAYKRGLDEKNVKSINNFLGENFTEKRLKEIKKDPRRDTYRQFLDIYLEKLHNMGYKSTSYLVRNVENNAPVYYLIFATTSDKAYSMYKNAEPTVKELMDEEWMKKLRFKIKPIVDRDQDQLTIGGFFLSSNF